MVHYPSDRYDHPVGRLIVTMALPVIMPAEIAGGFPFSRRAR
jgi:hypothetical protein